MDKHNRVLLDRLSESGVDVADITIPEVNTDCIELEPCAKSDTVVGVEDDTVKAEENS